MIGTNEQINGQLRHLLTGLSGLAVMYGIVGADEANQWIQVVFIAVGFVVMLIGHVQSWKSKTNIDKETEFIEKVLDRLEERKMQNQNGGSK